MSYEMTIAQFNEAHQSAFEYSPKFGVPVRKGPDHCPEVSVTLEVEGVRMVVGKGTNQKVARQDAVDQVLDMGPALPHVLRMAIESKLSGF